MKVVVLTTICLIVSVRGEDGFNYDDRSNWIDPSDMLNYDPSTQKMKKTQTPDYPESVDDSRRDERLDKLPLNPDIESAVYEESLIKLYDDLTKKYPGTKDEFVVTVKKYISNTSFPRHLSPQSKELSELKTCKDERRDLREEFVTIRQEQNSVSDSMEKTYFKRYVRTLLQHFSRSVADGSFLLFNTEVILSYDDILIMERFANSEYGNVQDVHDVVIRMIQHVELIDSGDAVALHGSNYEHYKEYLTITLQIVAVLTLASVAITLQVRLHLSWKQLFFKILLLLFLISIPWNWWHMYKVAVAKRQADVAKDIPLECRPDRQTASESFWTALRNTFTLNTDRCAEYYENMLVDPAYEVAPTQALAVTVTKFVVEPLEHIGHAVGKLIRGTLNELPVQLWPFALAFIFLMSFFLLTLTFGYRINLFYFFGIEPGKQHTRQSSIENDEKQRQLQNRIEDLSTQLKHLTLTQKSRSPSSFMEQIEIQPGASLLPSEPEPIKVSTQKSRSPLTSMEKIEIQPVASLLPSEPEPMNVSEELTPPRAIEAPIASTSTKPSTGSQPCELPQRNEAEMGISVGDIENSLICDRNGKTGAESNNPRGDETDEVLDLTISKEINAIETMAPSVVFKLDTCWESCRNGGYNSERHLTGELSAIHSVETLAPTVEDTGLELDGKF